MTRLRYEPVPDRLATWSVWLVDANHWLVGYVGHASGRWVARHRSDGADRVTHGHASRSDAARFLVVTGGFCQEPRVGRSAA